MIEDKNISKTSLKELGEFKLIKSLTDQFDVKNKSTIKSIGDDAAILSFNKKIVVSTDLLVEGVHFNLAYTPLKHLGYKAVMVNLSDINAMNAIATQITVSIAVSNRFSLESLEELTKEANTIIESLEAEKNLQNSIDSYQELLKLNSIIEKKFHKTTKFINEETKKKIKSIKSKKNEK